MMQPVTSARNLAREGALRAASATWANGSWLAAFVLEDSVAFKRTDGPGAATNNPTRSGEPQVAGDESAASFNTPCGRAIGLKNANPTSNASSRTNRQRTHLANVSGRSSTPRSNVRR